MRDPLSSVRIRYKLPLGFLAICLVAFGIGGVVLTGEARAALETQIERRLDERAAAVHVVVERHLDLHKRRAEDFASDGFIRAEFARLLAAVAAGEDALAQRARADLERHLQENKLPIVPAFVGAVLYDPAGVARLAVPEASLPQPPQGDSDVTSVGPLQSASNGHDYRTFRVTTPLQHQSERLVIGALQLVVKADTWVHGMRELAELPPLELDTMRLVGETGVTLDLQQQGSSQPVPRPEGAFEFRRAVAQTDWMLELEVDREEALAPAVRLRNQYILIGLLLLLATAGVLYFPVRFLLQPLSSIAEAARRISQGDFSARVEHESGDEIGDLAHAFNTMATAVEDRTTRLEQAARALGRREQDVRLERDRLSAVIHSMEDGLFILDPDGTVTLSNDAAQPIVDALAEHAAAPQRLECRHEEGEIPTCAACLAAQAEGRHTCLIERGGRIFEIWLTLLPAAPGSRPSRLCVSRDVTERIAAQEGQAHQERMSVLGEVAAVMAHELNNPLAAISMFSQMLQSKVEPGSDLQESADVIQRNVQICKQTIASLLDLAARGTLETAPFDTHDLLEDVRSFLRPIHERAGVVLVLEPGPVDGEVLGDEVQLRQVFINLVMNAIQASPKGGRITITTSEEDGRLTIRVRDEGKGIPEALRGRVFEPFFTTKGAGVGTGLGLPTSRRIVGEHGGELDLESSGPGGTTFVVRLPRKTARHAWQAAARMSASVVQPAGGHGSEGNGA